MALAAGCMNLRLYGAVKFKYGTFLSFYRAAQKLKESEHANVQWGLIQDPYLGCTIKREPLHSHFLGFGRLQADRPALNSRLGICLFCCMSRRAAEIKLSQEETNEPNRWIKSRKTEQRKVHRAKIVLRSAEAKTTHQIARELQAGPSTVSKWRKRFAKLRIAGLQDEQR
jgi:hypothetical protein